MADPTNPAETFIGLDIEAQAVEIELRVNDVPAFNPAETFGGEMQVVTQFPMNPAFRKGRNTVTVRVRMLPDGALGYTPLLKMDFGYWPIADRPFMFDGRPMAVRLSLKPEPQADGAPREVLSAQSEGQPLLQASQVARVDGSGRVGDWNTYRFDLDVAMELPAMAWMNGRILEDDAALRDSLLARMYEVNRALMEGGDAARAALSGFVARNAAAYNEPPATFFDISIAPMIDTSGPIEFLPFDVSAAELRIYGNGRLATFVPIPHRVYDTQRDEVGTLFLYYWKDAAGQWQLIH